MITARRPFGSISITWIESARPRAGSWYGRAPEPIARIVIGCPAGSSGVKLVWAAVTMIEGSADAPTAPSWIAPSADPRVQATRVAIANATRLVTSSPHRTGSA
jgi:hypothetical protein